MSNEPTSTIAEPFARLDVKTAQQLMADGAVKVIDVREPNEYAEGHIPGVTLVPLNTFLAQPQKYLPDDNVLFVCAMGARSALACEMAAAVGLEHVYNLEGGTVGWAKAGLPIDR